MIGDYYLSVLKNCESNLLNKNFKNKKNWIQGIDLARSQIKKLMYRISLILILIFGLTFSHLWQAI